MENESDVIVHLGIEIFGAIIITILVVSACAVARGGFNQLSYERNIVDEMQSKSSMIIYSGEATSDDVIKFIITYGDKYRYFVQTHQNGNPVYVTKDLPDIELEPLVDKMYTKGLTESNTYLKSLSFDPVEMIELFSYEAIDGKKYEISALNLDLSVEDINNGDKVAYILITEQ